ncbi:hypothetical protein AB4Y44_13670 [Paraburkholderia sp. BR10937]|uniref:hypothetical protein n=1 Tax=Paraburkholderia sp. BR10937 TaxID=3236994 RepID=UPI0034D2720E
MDSPEHAVRGADIVATCTNSLTPVLRAEWLAPGMHLVALTPREFDAEVARRFDVTVAQGQERLPLEEGERFSQRISGSPNAFVAGSEAERRRLPVSRGERVDTSRWPIYTDVITGRAPGRTSAEQITFYYTVGNWGVQFAAVGGHVYREAVRRGQASRCRVNGFYRRFAIRVVRDEGRRPGIRVAGADGWYSFDARNLEVRLVAARLVEVTRYLAGE